MRQRPQPPLTRHERRTLERRDRPARERPTLTRPRARRPAWQSPFALVSVGALAIALVVIFVNQRPSASAGKLVAPPVSYAGAVVKDQSLGSPTAPVVLGVYSDFQCPFCGEFVRGQFAALKTEFVDTGILRIEGHDIDILGRGSPDESVELATGARCAADQGKYWTFHDYVFWNQLPENTGGYTAEFIASIATASGVDMSAWKTCVSGATARAAVTQETDAAHRLGVASTPSISLNGAPPVAGVPDATALAAQIRSLAAAASGAPTATSGAPSATSAP